MTARDPLAAVRSAARTHQRDAAKADASRTDLIDAIVEALRQGAAPGDVSEASGWTGAQIRKVARPRGIQPTERYQRATESTRRTIAAKVAEEDAE